MAIHRARGGSVLALCLFCTVCERAPPVLGDGTQDAIIPLMATAAAIGFGGVVVQTASFQTLTDAVKPVERLKMALTL